MDNEKELIGKIKAGDKESFRFLVDEHKDKIYSLIVRMVSSQQDAQELTQDVFVKAYFSISKFRGDSAFSTWLFRIAYNISISFLRKKRRVVYKDNLESYITDYDDVEDVLMDKKINEEKFDKLEKALLELTAEDKFLVVAFYYEKKRIQELSELTQQSVSNIKVRLFRIKKKLLEELKK